MQRFSRAANPSIHLLLAVSTECRQKRRRLCETGGTKPDSNTSFTAAPLRASQIVLFTCACNNLTTCGMKIYLHVVAPSTSIQELFDTWTMLGSWCPKWFLTAITFLDSKHLRNVTSMPDIFVDLWAKCRFSQMSFAKNKWWV